MKNNSLLEIKDLTVSYSTPSGSLYSLRDISLNVPENKIVGIVGESGCGKSTLIASVLGLMSSNASIDKGQILFKNKNIIENSLEEWNDIRGNEISIIFQDPMQTHNPVISIGKQMTDIQYRSKLSLSEKRLEAVRMLDRVGIADPEMRLGQYPHEFSGGMRQRISIAMALMSEPELLIADEPTTALDATLEVQVLKLLKSLQEEVGCSIMFISHHLGAIAELCDEVVVMYAGEIVECGRIKDVFTDPRHPYTKALIECDPGYIKNKTEFLPTIDGDVPQLFNIQPSCIFHQRCQFAEDMCRNKTPEYHDLKNGRLAKCHLLSSS